ncbi:hypothetical protein F5B22DRAFT_494157 [Xylaria bambusicola]|uniref:uncharacterized protein n=1 Tax=Xylaria bambusicola TaxID=326684 RepID=UPI002007D256|nr:uncharacterized protein F5B22DRAFT_494157 [Xylaria bambusicola]KAI0505846.1 hypothetical protein F5B22DRAFT_494157 [Xylaria bambusicola]
MVHALITSILLLQLAASESVTITRLPAYSSQRPCAQQCFGGGIFTAAGALAYGIECEYRNPQNECVCRPDLQDQAEAYLQTCVDRGCTANSLDTNSAVSIYDEYCTSAGYIRNVAATTTSGSSPSLSSTKSQPQQTFHTSTTPSSSSNTVEDPSYSARPGETQTSAPTGSGSNDGNNENNNTNSNGGSSDENNNKGGGGGLDTGDVVGIVVGVLGFIATAIGTWFTYKSIKNKKRPQP